MKKWILSAAFLVALSGYAAAQTSQAKSATKKEVKTEKKTVVKKIEAKKDKETAEVKKPEKLTIKLGPVDSTGVPVAKKND